MQDLRRIIADILGCGNWEVDMLAESNIDIASTVQYIVEEGLPLNMCSLYYEAFKNKVTEEIDFNRDKGADENDFEMYYNGALDTHIYIKNGKYSWYKENYPGIIDSIEDYMNMEFEESVY